MSRPWRAAALAVLALAVAYGAVICAARAFGWQAGPLYFLVALTPYVGAAALVAAVLAALLRAWWLVLPALLVAALVAWWWVPAFRPAPGSERWDLQVMTTNLRFGQGDPATVVAAVREHGVDLLSVQELTGPAVAGLREAGLDELLPYRYVRPGGGAAGTGMWSRYPIQAPRETDDLVFENLAAQIATPSGPVTFFAVHPIPPQPLDGNRGEAVFAAMHDLLAGASGLAIAAGDFNATRDNVPIRELEGIGYLDAATVAGAGMVRTWRNDLRWLPPLVALDHVLTRAVPPARDVIVLDVPGTDHRAVIADL